MLSGYRYEKLWFKYKSKGSASWLDMKGMREKAYRQNKPGMREKAKKKSFSMTWEAEASLFNAEYFGF